MKKKILFFIHNMEDGGAQKVLVHLVNNMDPSKFDITVRALFGGGVNEQFLAPHIRYERVIPRAVRGNSHAQKLLSPEALHRLCIREHYDIEVAYLEGVTARIVSGCPDPDTKLVCWIHSTLRDEADRASCFRSAAEARDCYGRFQRIICVSRWIRDRYRADFGNEPPVEVCYNTIETTAIVEGAGEPVPGSEGVFRLVSVGSLKPVKGFDRLIRVHARLRAAGLPVQTWLVGQGPDLEALRRQAAECGCADSVVFAGFDINPWKYVRSSHLFVCSSWSEGFSTAATEALIVGTPVCTVEVSGMKEMLGEQNEYGVVTENSEDGLFEGIRDLLTDPGKLDHYKQQAALRGRSFRKEETVRVVEEMLLCL